MQIVIKNKFKTIADLYLLVTQIGYSFFTNTLSFNINE